MSNEKEASTGLFTKRSQPADQASTWFSWHADVIGPGSRVLDLACGAGRHAIPAALRGATVVAVDQDAERLAALERAAGLRRVAIDVVRADLTAWDPGRDAFDVVMIFNYLDRRRMPDFLAAVRPGGHLLTETFLEQQRLQGWGPRSDEHLLASGELMRLTERFELILGREVIETIDGRPAALASVFAQRPLA